MSIKIDLHNHSVASHDGGVSLLRYKEVLAAGTLDLIAITDHGRIDMAQEIKAKIGEKIIVGEEIKSKSGDIIGLYLNEPINSGLSLTETVRKIKDQKGLVYIPHPLETRRKGLSRVDLESIKDDIDIIEIFNARSISSNAEKILNFARENNIPTAAGSDSHCSAELGRTYTIIDSNVNPTNKTLKNLLKGARLEQQKILPHHFFCPAINKIKHVFV